MSEYLNNLKKLVEENYDVTVLNMIKFKNVYKIVAVEGNFCLKQFKYSFCRLKHVLEIFEHFNRKNFKNIPEIIPCNLKREYVELNGIYFYMTHWIESRELNYSNIYDVEDAAFHIAKFHIYGRDFKISDETKADIRWFRWIEIFNRKIDDILKFRDVILHRDELSVFDKIYLKNVERNISLANESIENLYRFDYKSVMKHHIVESYICHHDLAGHNILKDREGKLYFIDFDYVILDTFLHDLASFLMRTMKIGRWNIGKLRIIVNSYRSVKQLSKQELSLAMSFLLFPNDFWQLGFQYYVEEINWDEEKFLRRLTRFENDKDDRISFIRNVILNQ